MNIQIKDNVISLDDLEKVCKKLNEQKEEEKKHLKGYMFDSLIYRYKLARHKMTEFEIAEAKKAQDYKYDYKHYYNMEERDVMRFIQILDEAIGKHD